jgi:hypothetical protein
VCIVNQEFVRRYLRGRDPLAASVNVTPLMMGPSPAVPDKIVGIIGQKERRLLTFRCR